MIISWYMVIGWYCIFYIKRLESLGGERLENFTEVKEIEELCLNTVGCIGYNTQGFLKTTLSPFDKWTHLEHQGGLYVLGIVNRIKFKILLFHI